VLDIVGIVIQQLHQYPARCPLIGIIKRNQRRRAGVLHLFLLPEYQTRAIGCTFTGALF
jgi:hypothetical protein